MTLIVCFVIVLCIVCQTVPEVRTTQRRMAKKLRYAQTVHFHTDRKIMIKSYRFWLGIIITDLRVSAVQMWMF